MSDCRKTGRATPPNYWLNSIGLSLAGYFQKQLDDATLLLFSTFDRSLLLINSVLELQINPRKCRYEKVENQVKDQTDLLRALQKLERTVKPLADLRHFYVHRGESRQLQSLDLLRLIQLMEQRREIMTEQDVPATTQKQILETIRSEISKIIATVEELKEQLLSYYVKRVEELGGVIMPSREEVNQFRPMLEAIASSEPLGFHIPAELLDPLKVH